MENIYFNCLLTKRIVVESKYLDENIDTYIDTYIKRKIEGLCIDEGYVQPETVKILRRGIGLLYGSRFTGDITYEIAYSAEVCNPMVGNIIECKVKFINKLGVLGNNGPITIIVGKQFHENLNDLDKINPILRDRLHIVNIQGYSNEEKKIIVSKYIIPKLEVEYKVNIQIDPEVIDSIVSNTSQHKGIRQIQMYLTKIYELVILDKFTDKFKFGNRFKLKDLSKIKLQEDNISKAISSMYM